jgi:hypothetical protein
MEKDLILSPELVRIHAHLCGDGSVYLYKTKAKDRKFIGVVGYYNKNQELLEKFRNDFNKLFGVKMKMRKNISVSISSIKRVKYFINTFGKFGSREWKIHGSIKNSNKELKVEWLKAFFEDEAYHEKKYNRLKIKSMNFRGLKDAKELIDSLNIFSKTTGPNIDGSYYLTIPRFNYIKEFNNFVKTPIRK